MHVKNNIGFLSYVVSKVQTETTPHSSFRQTKQPMGCAGSHENLGRTSTSFFPLKLFFFSLEQNGRSLRHGINVQGAVGTVRTGHYRAVLVCPCADPRHGGTTVSPELPAGLWSRALPAPTAPPGIPGVVCRRCLPAPGASTSRHSHGNQQMFSQTLLLKVPVKPEMQWLPRTFLPQAYQIISFL